MDVERDFKDTLSCCLEHLYQEGAKPHTSPEQVEKFKKGLYKVMEEFLMNSSASDSPFSYLSIVLENLTRLSAKVAVSIAIIDPLILYKNKHISIESRELLRRGIEDKLTEILHSAFKEHLLNNHLELTEFHEKGGK